MNKKVNKAIVVASAALASLGVMKMASGQVLIQNNQSAVVDGWNITAPTGVSLTVTTSDGEIFIEKAANFTVPGQGFQVAFQPVGDSQAAQIDFTDETIQNNTGKAFSGFDFILMNIGSANATFDGVGNIFAPPSGTGYAYTTASLNLTKDILSYTGNQDAGSTSSWGSAHEGDNLLIDAPSGSAFSFKELSIPGGGGAVPLPAAAWQSLAGLAALGMIGLGRRMKRNLA